MERGDDALPRAGVSRVSINPSPGESWVIGPHDPDFAISSDGERIAYIGRREDRNHLVVRRLDEFEGTSLGSFNSVVRHPFFSPDGAWVAFADGNVLKKAAIDASATVTICVLPGYMSGADWGPDDSIVFGTVNGGLYRVPSSGGEAVPFPTRAQQERLSARWPVFLPGGQAVLFAAVGGTGQEEVRVRSLDGDDEQILVEGATFPRYADTGHLLYVANGVLWGIAFDLGRLTTLGEPVPVVDGIMIKGPGQSGFGAANVGLSENGTLVYRPTGNAGSDANTLVWVDRTGHEEALGVEPRSYGRMQLSPDGTSVAVEITDASVSDSNIWVGRVDGTALSQFTFDQEPDDFPVWTTDGVRVIFRSGREGGGLFWKRADGTGTVETLLRIESVPRIPASYSDRRAIVRNPATYLVAATRLRQRLRGDGDTPSWTAARRRGNPSTAVSRGMGWSASRKQGKRLGRPCVEVSAAGIEPDGCMTEVPLFPPYCGVPAVRLRWQRA